MLKIRLSRTGKKNQPSFRVVVQEHTAPVKGKFVEELGFYRPAEDPKVFKIDMDRVKYWMSVGATPSDTMAVLLKNEGLEGMDKYIAPRNKQAKKKKEEEEKPEAPAEGAAPAPAEGAEEAAPAEAPAETPKEEEPKAEEPPAEPAEESPKEEPPAAEEAKAEEKPAEEKPAEEPAAEEPKEETKPE